MSFVEGTSRDALGNIIIVSRMQTPPARQGFEKLFFPGVEVGLEGWERAHSQGPITGKESPDAIRFAPREVNQEFQRLGIEKFIQELFKERDPNVELWLTTVTSTHPRTLRLHEIQYRVDALNKKGESKALFEASIEIEDKRKSPRVTTQARERTPRQEWLPFIKDLEEKRNQALAQVIEQRQRVINLVNLLRGEHEAQLELVNNSFAGFWTNRLFNVAPPLLMIWNDAFGRLTAAETAIKHRDVKRAQKETVDAYKEYLQAQTRYLSWKNGIDGAGTQAQVAIGAVAIAIPVLIAAPQLIGAGVRMFFLTEASVAGGTAATAAEQTMVRVAGSVERLNAAYRVAETASLTEAELAEGQELRLVMEEFMRLGGP